VGAKTAKAPNSNAPDTKAAAAKSSDTKAPGSKTPITKTASLKKEESKVHEHNESRRNGLVPPPPPETPALLSAPAFGNVYLQQFLPVEETSPDTLKQREKDLNTHLQNAKVELKDKQKALSDKSDRIKQFDELFQEGVISRRELESSKEELKQSQSDIDTAKSMVSDIQYALARVGDRLKALSKLGFTPGRSRNVVSKNTGGKNGSKDKKGAAKQTVAASSQVSAKSLDNKQSTAVSAPSQASPEQKMTDDR
jgi:vacuolar-type H+-ATPase subunit I/STV1